VLHLATDEFLHGPPDNPIACLRDAPADVLAVRLRPAELVLLEKSSDYDFYRCQRISIKLELFIMSLL